MENRDGETCKFCDMAIKSREMCPMHYSRWLKGLRGDELAAPKKPIGRPRGRKNTCKYCDEKSSSKGMCGPHYQRWKRGLRGKDITAPITKYPTTVIVEEYQKMVRRIREHNGMSQKEFAVAVGVCYATVNRWERGHGEPSRVAMKILQQFQQQMDAEEDTKAIVETEQASVANNEMLRILFDQYSDRIKKLQDDLTSLNVDMRYTVSMILKQ